MDEKLVIGKRAPVKVNTTDGGAGSNLLVLLIKPEGNLLTVDGGA